MEKINVNGITLAYTRRGRGKPLMLIHGYPLDQTIWDRVAHLLEGTFDVILPDLRGFGASSTIESQYSLDDMARDLVGLLDAIGLGKIFMAGHSMGGYLALAFARNHPSRLIGLGLVASQLLADPPANKEGRYKTAAEVAEKGVGIVADGMTPKLTSNAGIQKGLHALILRQSKSGVIGALKAMAERQDSTEFIRGFELPLVLVHGEADALLPIERAREAKAASKSARLLELTGVGHMPMLEAPQETAWALRQLQ